MMKSNSWFLVAVLLFVLSGLLVSPVSNTATADQEVQVFIDGKRLELDDPPIIQEGRVLVPMRHFFAALGADVSWDEANRIAVGTRAGVEVRIPIDSTEPTVDGETVKIDVAAQITNGRTYIPLRFVGEALGVEVRWDEEARRIDITVEPDLSGVTGWTVGNRDQDGVSTAVILHTNDGGANWTEQDIPETVKGLQGTDISAADDLTAWATVGDGAWYDEESRGAILHTDDGGLTWSVQESLSFQAKQVTAVSESKAWAVTLNGKVYRTTDGGNNWENISTGDIEMYQINRMDAMGDSIWIADWGDTRSETDRGKVVYSEDFGETWQAIEIADADNEVYRPFQVSIASPQVVWVASRQPPLVYRTLDGGETWQTSGIFTGEGDFDDICAIDDTNLWIAQDHLGTGFLYKMKWDMDREEPEIEKIGDYPKGYAYVGVSCISESIVWAVGFDLWWQNGDNPKSVILNSTDGGKTWDQQQIPAGSRDVELWKVSFVRERQ